MDIEQNIWGFTPDGEAVVIYTMTNSKGSSVRLTNVGAAIVGISVPDREGNFSDVVLGYDNFNDYINDNVSMGKTVGRYSGIIRDGAFSIGQKHYTLPRNSPPDHRDGGSPGLGNRVWESRVEINRVVFCTISPDNDQGYPEELSIEVVYDWDDDNVLEITVLAKSNGLTPVNICNNTFFNLSGDCSRTISEHTVCVSPKVKPDVALSGRVPLESLRDTATGEIKLSATFEGDDHHSLHEVFAIHDPASGRRLSILTTQPYVDLYSGYELERTSPGKEGYRYRSGSGFSVRCQALPQELKPGLDMLPGNSIYEEHTAYRFFTE